MNKDNHPNKKQTKDIQISQRLCDFLDREGWAWMKNNRQSEVLLLEVIENSSLDNSLNVYAYGGSYAEGSELIDSDVDFTSFTCRAVAVSSPNEAKLFEKDVLLMCPENHRPCYLTLKLLKTINVLHLTEKLEGIYFLSSRKYTQTYFHFLTPPLHGVHSLKLHGPCSAVFVGTGYVESVDAIPATKWPSQALNWISRKRKFGWPNMALIQKIVDARCSLVPVGNPASPLQHIEWRLSFLLGERLLVWSFNKIQFYCFVVTKHIMNEFIASKFPDTVDSFLLKTAMFWMIEETPSEFWSKENLVICIKAILSRLTDYIKQESLPHYFVPTNNLLLCKIIVKNQWQSIVKELESINEDLHSCLHIITFGFSCGPACPLCTGQHMSGLTKQSKQKSNDYSPFIQIRMRIIIQNMNGGLEKVKAVKRLLSEKPKCIYQEHVDTLKKMLNVKKGFELYKLIVEKSDRNISMENVEKSFIKGIDKEAVDGWLYLATFYYMQGKETNATYLVESLLNGQLPLLNRLVLKCGEVDLLGAKKDENIPMYFEDELLRTTVLTFCKSWHICLPSPIACECLMYKTDIGISASIYAYFLMFMVHLKQKRLDILQEILLQFEEEVHQYTNQYKDVDMNDLVLTLLGVCLMENGSYQKALLYFHKSYQERPTTKNPCLYYAFLTIIKCQKRKEENYN